MLHSGLHKISSLSSLHRVLSICIKKVALKFETCMTAHVPFSLSHTQTHSFKQQTDNSHSIKISNQTEKRGLQFHIKPISVDLWSHTKEKHGSLRDAIQKKSNFEIKSLSKTELKLYAPLPINPLHWLQKAIRQCSCINNPCRFCKMVKDQGLEMMPPFWLSRTNRGPTFKPCPVHFYSVSYVESAKVYLGTTSRVPE